FRIGEALPNFASLFFGQRDFHAMRVRGPQFHSFEAGRLEILADRRYVPVFRDVVSDDAKPHPFSAIALRREVFTACGQSGRKTDGSQRPSSEGNCWRCKRLIKGSCSRARKPPPRSASAAEGWREDFFGLEHFADGVEKCR